LNPFLYYPQSLALTTEATEVLYGGAAGGGKSHLLRVASIFWGGHIPGLQIYLFRRTYPDLRDNHLVGVGSYWELLEPWIESGYAHISQGKMEIDFANGSRIHLCHCQHEHSVRQYHGASIHVLLIDELTHFTETIYRFLRHRVRVAEGLEIPEWAEGHFPRILCGSNPGSVGHQWVKAMWVNEDPRGSMKIWRAPKEDGGMLRQYIPAKLDDNPALARADPDYIDRLSGLGDPALVQAMREGSWDIAVGGFFDDAWHPDHQVVPPFEPPAHWRRFRAFDWGSAAPSSLGFYCESQGEPLEELGGRRFPRGSVIRYDEWYTVQRNQFGQAIPNEGTRLSNIELGQGIAERSKDIEWNGCVADPSIFTREGGDSIYQQMQKASAKAGHHLSFRPADNSRVPGWQKLRSMLVNAAPPKDVNPKTWYAELPGFYVTANCKEWLRTVPVIPRDERRREDVDTKAEDHAADETRYALMASRGRIQTVKVKFG
jgi:hypothetical protein